MHWRTIVTAVGTACAVSACNGTPLENPNVVDGASSAGSASNTGTTDVPQNAPKATPPPAAAQPMSLSAAVSGSMRERLAAMHTSDAALLANISELRKQPQQAVRALDAEFKAAGTKQGLARWRATYALSALRSREATTTLIRIAMTDENSGAGLSEYERDEATSTRIRAFEGLEALAREGDVRASDALWKGVLSDDPVAKRCAVRAYLAVHPDQRARVQAALSSKDQVLMTLHPMTEEEGTLTPGPVTNAKSQATPAP